MTETLTLTLTTDSDTYTATISGDALEADDVLDWLPAAFTAVQFSAVASELEKPGE